MHTNRIAEWQMASLPGGVLDWGRVRTDVRRALFEGGMRTVDDVRRRAERGDLGQVHGIGPARQQAILTALAATEPDALHVTAAAGIKALEAMLADPDGFTTLPWADPDPVKQARRRDRSRGCGETPPCAEPRGADPDDAERLLWEADIEDSVAHCIRDHVMDSPCPEQSSVERDLWNWAEALMRDAARRRAEAS